MKMVHLASCVFSFLAATMVPAVGLGESSPSLDFSMTAEQIDQRAALRLANEVRVRVLRVVPDQSIPTVIMQHRPSEQSQQRSTQTPVTVDEKTITPSSPRSRAAQQRDVRAKTRSFKPGETSAVPKTGSAKSSPATAVDAQLLREAEQIAQQKKARTADPTQAAATGAKEVAGKGGKARRTDPAEQGDRLVPARKNSAGQDRDSRDRDRWGRPGEPGDHPGGQLRNQTGSVGPQR